MVITSDQRHFKEADSVQVFVQMHASSFLDQDVRSAPMFSVHEDGVTGGDS